MPGSPRLLTGAVHPHLVLQGVAARGVVLFASAQPCLAQPGGGCRDVLGGCHLDTEVVQAGVRALFSLDQNELERRLGDGEVRIAITELGRLGVEEFAVEGDG